MEDTKKASNFLNQFGLDDNILFDPSALTFFSWLAENTTEENYLTVTELSEFSDLEKNKQVLSREELDKSLSNINLKFPNLTSYKDNDVYKFEVELENLVEIEEEYEILLNDEKDLLSELKRDNIKLDSKILELEYLEQEHVREGSTKIKELQELHQDIEKNSHEIEKTIMISQCSPYFIYQFPLSDHIIRCQEFINSCETYMRKNFEIQSLNTNKLEHSPEIYLQQFDTVKERIGNSYFKLLQEEMENQSFQYVLQKFQTFNIDTKDFQNIKFELDLYTQQVKEMAALKPILMEQLQNQINQISTQKVYELIFQINTSKLKRAMLRQNDIQAIYDVSQQFLFISQLLFFCIQLDQDILTKFCESVKMEHVQHVNNVNCLKRVEELGKINEEESEYIFEFCNKIMQALYRNSKQLSLKDYMLVKSSIENNIKNILSRSATRKSDEIICKLKDNIDILQHACRDDPLVRPQLVDPFFSEKLFDVNIDLELIKNELKLFKSNYTENYTKPMNTDKFWKYLNSLWMLFLTEPKKVIHAIQQIKEATAELTAQKNFSGLLCKRN